MRRTLKGRLRTTTAGGLLNLLYRFNTFEALSYHGGSYL
jgi:hypothetical protein